MKLLSHGQRGKMTFVWDEITSGLISMNELLKGSYCAAHENAKKKTKQNKKQQQKTTGNTSAFAG